MNGNALNVESEDKNMIITGMAHFESVCKKKLVDWYNENGFADTPLMPPIDLSNVFVVWSCKTLQNYKCLTYNGDKQELYEDVYKKVHNKCHEEE